MAEIKGQIIFTRKLNHEQYISLITAFTIQASEKNKMTMMPTEMTLAEAKTVLAIELLCNTQALDLQRPLTSSPALEEVYKAIRAHVPPIEDDRIFYKDINNVIKVINSGEIIKAAELHTGVLN